jgi:hypothetical protein
MVLFKRSRGDFEGRWGVEQAADVASASLTDRSTLLMRVLEKPNQQDNDENDENRSSTDIHL